MLPPVLQDVYERMTNGAWGRQRARVISVEPDPPSPTKRAVDGFRKANGESLNAALEYQGCVRLDEQVDVIVLDAELKHSEAVGLRPLQGPPDRREDIAAP